MAKDLAVVLNNGSVNSAVATAMAAQRYRPILLFADTTTNSQSRGRAAFDQQVAHFKPYREYALSMPFAAMLTPAGGAAGTANAADPRSGTQTAPLMFDLLPLLAVAVKLAAHHQAAAVYLGARVGPNVEELTQATEYFQIWNELVQHPCGQPEMEIHTPLLELETWQVVDVGFQVGAPFERTWSCDEESSDPCGTCRGCRAREAAFQQAAKPDPAGAKIRK